MWSPTSWHDLAALVGQAEESSALDFKREVGGRASNSEVAKDIAAMTVNGGVLLYGVEEDPQTRVATALPKVPLQGLEERFRQIAGTRIAPPPEFGFRPLIEQTGDTEGVAAVVVPPSSLAPHQVEGRFPVRSGTTTRSLEEAEIERLYEQRRRSQELPSTAGELLADFDEPPGTSGDFGTMLTQEEGRLRLLVRPAGERFHHPASPWLQEALDDAALEASNRVRSRMQEQLFPPVLNRLASWRPHGTVGWVAGEATDDQAARAARSTHAATYGYPGRFSFQITWPLVVGGTGGQYRCAYEWIVAAELVGLLAVAGAFFAREPGGGSLVCAAQLAGFQGAVSSHATRGTQGMSVDHLPTAPHHLAESTVAPALTCRDRPEDVGRELIDRWLVSFYEGPELFGGLFAN